ncbi:Flp pilus assembly protein CpaB [Pendulispora brunnea]|uniref:Flp pilus assembly protein CpaB n=1 Tax=Pendulispora brunnea TaxID=2905690 RepID=A0ABZ2KG37_9BACT
MKLRATLLAMLIASVGGFLLWQYLKRFEAEASGGARIGVLVSVRTLEPGAILRDEDIGERFIPQSYVESRSIRSSDRSRIANLRIAAPLEAQQLIMWTDIVLANDDKRDVASLVQPNMRAVTIHTETKASMLVHAGDRVDVLGTFQRPNSSDVRTGVVLLQNVLVLGRSNDATDHGQQTEGSDLALSLSLQNAQILSVAADKGKLSVALRSPEDNRLQDGLGEYGSDKLVTLPQKAAVAAAPAGPQAMQSVNR